MRRLAIRRPLSVVACACALPLAAAAVPSTRPPAAGGGPAATAERTLTRATLEDKVRGGWAGQMIGVSFGAPTEFTSNGARIEGPLAWAPDRIANAIQQDDLYVEMTFAEVMDRVGLDATAADYGAAFRDSKYMLWHANASARKWLSRGVLPPLSGDPRYNRHANDIDFQIESDFIGLMTPGLPREAARYAERVGRVMNAGDGLYGGYFVTGMYAAAFFETDVRTVVEAGWAMLPPESGYARLIRDVLTWSQQHPEDWTKTWQLVQDRWDRDDPCPDGALAPFNIDARLNGAYIALGLLYGRGDFHKTIELTTRCGQDSDCNPSNAAGILGVMIGYEKIPTEWRSGIPAIADRKFDYTTYSFNDITQSTLRRALEIVRRAGGRVDGDRIVVPAQVPQPPALEQWDPGRPAAVLATSTPAWTFTGAWTPRRDRKGAIVGQVSSEAGATATVAFSGRGVALVGQHGQKGGRADVFLDGKPAGQIDNWIPERTFDNDLLYLPDLGPGTHTLKVVVRGDADARSGGREVGLERVVVFEGGSRK